MRLMQSKLFLCVCSSLAHLDCRLIVISFIVPVDKRDTSSTKRHGEQLSECSVCSSSLRKYRYSSVPESWVRWRSFAMSVSARLCPGCRRTSGVTCPVRITRNSRSNAWPSWSSRGTWGSTSNSALGRGGNCGRRSSLSSTSLASRTRWPWVPLWDLVSLGIY